MLSTIQKLLLAFITLIIGLVLVGSVATSTSGLTSLNGISSEVHTVGSTYATGGNTTTTNPSVTYTVTHAPTSWKVDECPLTNFVLKNSSGSVLAEGASNGYVVDLSRGTYYLRDTAGTLLWRSNGAGDNQTLASYNYCPDTYMIGWGGTVLNLVPGFFALAILIFSVGMFYSLARDTGIL